MNLNHYLVIIDIYDMEQLLTRLIDDEGYLPLSPRQKYINRSVSSNTYITLHLAGPTKILMDGSVPWAQTLPPSTPPQTSAYASGCPRITQRDYMAGKKAPPLLKNRSKAKWKRKEK